MKTKLLIVAFLTFASLMGGSPVSAQESESPFSVGVDLYSRYVWRGLDFGASPSIQPCLEYSKGSFGIGAWGAYTTDWNMINGGAQEMDLYAYYTIAEKITVTMTDYFFPADGGLNNYLEYNDTITGHVIEGMVSFDGTEDLPLTVTAAVNLYGEASYPDNSMYLELGYGFENVSAFMGFATGSWYTTNGNFQGVNFGISTEKEIKITDDFSLPFSGSLIMNPNTENIFLVVGISL